MFTFLNIISGKLQRRLGASRLGRAAAFLLALALIAFSLFYGYARYVQLQDAQQMLEERQR